MSPFLTLIACAPKTAEVDAAAEATDHRSTMPEPLPAREFSIPTPARGELSSGIPVLVVENHEVPLVYVRVVFSAGDASAENPALASVTLDMMNEGAGEYDAEALSAALKQMATDIGTTAGPDSSQVWMSSLAENLEPSLDLLRTVVLEPTFAEAEWDLMLKRRLQNLEGARSDPQSIADRVFRKLIYSGAYVGDLTTEEHLEALDPSAMRQWYDDYIVPANAMILVGGDTTLEEIQPMLEARFGQWAKAGKAAEDPAATILVEQDGPRVFLVDKPGAEQSVIQLGTFVGPQSDATTYYPKKMADMVMAGMFTSRINLNLREDKGYTYGAYGWTYYNSLDGYWRLRTNVRTDATAASLTELLTEIRGPALDKPFTTDELDAGRGQWLGTHPLRFENPGFLLDQMVDVWRYDLPEDWVAAMPEGIRKVTVDEMNRVWTETVPAEELTIVVVGDASQIREGIEALELPIVELDVDGNPIE